MSELESILNDIQEGKDLEEIVDTTKDDPLDKITTEGRPMVDADTETQQVNLRVAEEELLTEVTNHYNLQMIGHNLKSVEKVDKSIVLEAMASLPEYFSVTDKAKITSVPSLINKEVLDNAVNIHTVQMRQKCRELAERLMEDLQPFEDRIDKPLRTLNSYIGEINKQLAEAGSPRVLIDNTTVELLVESVELLSYKDFSSVDYDKYQNGKLNSLYTEIHRQLQNSELLSKLVEEGYGIGDLVDAINSTLLSVVADSVGNVINLLKIGKEYLSKTEEDAINSDLFVNFNGHYQDIERYNESLKLVKEGENIFDAILELLEFLD